MSMVAEAGNYYPAYTPSMAKFFSDLIHRFSVFVALKAAADELALEAARNELLEKAHDLAKVLQVLADNPMPITGEAVSATRKALEWMRECLESGENRYNFNDSQKQRLERSYLEIAEGLSLVTIQNAYLAQFAE